MPKPLASLTALLALVVAPGLARADDDPATSAIPDEEAPVVDPPAPEAEPMPPSTTPVLAPAPASDRAADWCGSHARWHAWSDRPPRIAIGFAQTRVDLGDDDTRGRSLLARVVLHHGFEAELELAKLQIDGDDARTAGGSLLRVFGHHAFHPYVIAGFGGGKVERADGSEPHLHYAELGAGLMLRHRHFALGVDVRRGVRSVDASAEPTGDATRMTMPTPTDSHDRERYTRSRIMALFYF